MRTFRGIGASILFVFAALWGSATIVTAGEGGYQELVNTVLCSDAECTGWETLDGATVSAVTDEGGEVIVSCEVSVSATPPGCLLDVPASAGDFFHYEWDDALVPEGYAPFGPPETVDGALTMFYAPAGEAETTKQVVAVVYSCETTDCVDADGVKDPLAGATVTAFAADGSELDSCTTGESYEGGCDLAIPANDDGSYEVTAPEGYESYTLLSSTPEVTGEGGDGREWTFVPVDEPGDGVAVNVVACDVAGCTDPATMDGAVVTSFDGSGEQIDSCTVDSAADDFDGCTLVLPASSGSVEIAPAEGYEDYVLVSDEPEVFESPERGPIYLWTFVPGGGEDAEPTGTPDADDVVTALPETGSGPAADPGATTGLALVTTALVLLVACIRAGRTRRTR